MSLTASITTRLRASRTAPPAVAAALVITSGAFMLAAGYTLARTGWASARPFAIGGGATIQLALFLERRVVRERANRTRHGRAWMPQVGATALMGSAGAGLVFIGHAASTAGWWPVTPAVAPLLAIVAAAAALNRAAAEIRGTRAIRDAASEDARARSSARARMRT